MHTFSFVLLIKHQRKGKALSRAFPPLVVLCTLYWAFCLLYLLQRGKRLLILTTMCNRQFGDQFTKFLFYSRWTQQTVCFQSTDSMEPSLCKGIDYLFRNRIEEMGNRSSVTGTIFSKVHSFSMVSWNKYANQDAHEVVHHSI